MTRLHYLVGALAIMLVVSGFFLFDSRTRLDNQQAQQAAKSNPLAHLKPARQTTRPPQKTQSTKTTSTASTRDQRVPMQTTLRKSTPVKKTTTTTTTQTAQDSSGGTRSRLGPPSKRF